jgi:hypothetical protein
MLLSTTAFAATTTKTVTKYSTTGTTVTSTVSGLTENSMVTYLAVKGDNQAVSENGDNIVYIGQETVGSSKSAKFEYKINDNIGVGTYATIKYGSNVDAISGTNTVNVGKAVVTWDQVVGTVTGEVLVGGDDEVEITLEAAANSEIVKITKNGVAIEIQNTIKAAAGDQIVVTAIPTTGSAAVYQLKGATIADTAVYEGIWTKSGIVRVIGAVDQVYFEFKNDGVPYEMDGVSQFDISDLLEAGEGYYGVEIEALEDISSYEAVVTAKSGEATITPVVITVD